MRLDDLPLDHVAADQEQRLPEAQRGRGDRGAAVDPRAAAEGVEDRARGGRVGRPRWRGCPPARFGIAVDHVGRLRQGVGHLVRGQRAGDLVREEPGVLLVARHGAPTTGRRPPRWRSSGSGRGGRTCARRSAWPGRRAARDGPAGSTGSGRRAGRPAPCRRTGPRPSWPSRGRSTGCRARSSSRRAALRGSSVGGDLDRRAVEQPRLGGLLRSAGARPAPRGRS